MGNITSKYWFEQDDVLLVFLHHVFSNIQIYDT